MTMELDHPCKETCSGWKQGYERGAKVFHLALEKENAELRVALKRMHNLLWTPGDDEPKIAEAMDFIDNVKDGLMDRKAWPESSPSGKTR